MNQVLKMAGDTLSEVQYNQIYASSVREFSVPLPPKNEIGDRLYFLLVGTETQKILASGYLKLIYPVIFRQESFSFLNIGGVIADEKGKGYGKKLMLAIREHLISCDLTGLGFCWPNNRGFYEKCGFVVEINSTQRFIYRNGAEQSTAEGQYILYLDSSAGLMQKVLSIKDQEVIVPEPTIW